MKFKASFNILALMNKVSICHKVESLSAGKTKFKCMYE